MRKDGVAVTPQTLQMAIDLGIDEDITGQDTQGDGEAALAAFSARLQSIMERECIDMVYNADQTGVNYEYLPAKTIHARGENTEWIKCGWKTKGRATAMLVADCTGKKYPLFIVLKTGASKIKDVNSSISVDFLKFHFADRMDRPAKFMWDDFSTHFTVEVVSCAEDLNVVLSRRD
ncbi:hypothetical protein H257_05585 [Aphanomyces astaci]|uniref:DDE-1 domain-containing protein n=1 Tax=Aphanomyces astaci TaxID=112090 RepID=W4GQT5_APHAT|nr:hypothetical protein H257_05585 [Aphanomyces astaci]ETV82070.1 hypothetical protein H257_05585 [Aphanomyces astaci]|eukprot:XP_009828807.1 hypothetical protein H257_05585 [Aphanomyces astaci]